MIQCQSKLFSTTLYMHLTSMPLKTTLLKRHMCRRTKSLKKAHDFLCFRKLPKTIPVESYRITCQVVVRFRRKAHDFLALLVVNDVFSCTFLGSLCDTEKSARAFACIYVVHIYMICARSALLQLVSQMFQPIRVRLGLGTKHSQSLRSFRQV